MSNDDAFSLNELCTFGLKGACTFTFHAMHNINWSIDEDNKMKPKHDIIAKLSALLANSLRYGEFDKNVLELLDKGHTEN